LHQDGFALDAVGARRILNQLDQVVAVDDLAGGDGQVFADAEGFDAGGRFVAQ